MAGRKTEGQGELEAARLRLAAARAQASSAGRLLRATDEAKESAEREVESRKHEVKHAKQRLTAAKSHASTANKTMQTAVDTKEAADKEVKTAEELLKEAEERWEVLEVDDSDDEAEAKESCKNQKVVDGVVEEIVVEGAGLFSANGTYKRNGEVKGFPRYTKAVGVTSRLRFFIYRTGPGPRSSWCICFQCNQNYNVIYTSRIDSPMVPRNGWYVSYFGGRSAPQLRYKG